MVRLGRDMVEAHLADAPERFVLHARNPGRHLHVGDNVVNFGPVTGAPHIRDLEGGRRYGDLAGFRNILRLTHKLGILHWQGGIVVEPVDIPVAVRHLLTYQAHIECADIVWAARGIGGALAQQTAEALGVVTLCQMLRPGTPCVIGGFTSNVDMRTGSPAFGTPEYCNAVLASAQIGRRLRIPVRTSAVNASPVVDAQSTYETAFSLQAAILSHSHLINHAAGWLEGGLSASLEKIVVDAELPP